MCVHIRLLTHPDQLENECQSLKRYTITKQSLSVFARNMCSLTVLYIMLDNCVFVLHSNVYVYRYAYVHVTLYYEY